MKRPTDKEITDLAIRLWPEIKGEYGDGEHGIEIEWRGRECHLSVYKMYDREGMSLGFPQMLELSRLFDTMMVEEYDTIASGGCETCDYGSRFGFVFRIAPGAPYDPTIAEKHCSDNESEVLK